MRLMYIAVKYLTPKTLTKLVIIISMDKHICLILLLRSICVHNSSYKKDETSSQNKGLDGCTALIIKLECLPTDLRFDFMNGQR